MKKSKIEQAAGNLVDTFKTLDGIFYAAQKELAASGMSESDIIYIKFIKELFFRCRIEAYKPKRFVLGQRETDTFLYVLYSGSHYDEYYVMFLDEERSIIAIKEIAAAGIMNAFEVRKIICSAVDSGAYYIELISCRRDGIILPSPEDIALTRQYERYMAMADIEFDSYLLIYEDEYVNVKEHTDYVTKL